MAKLSEFYWKTTASERIAAIIALLGLSLLAILHLDPAGTNSTALYVPTAAFMVSFIVAIFMLAAGGGRYEGFWRRLVDRCLPLLTWALTLTLLIFAAPPT